MSESVDKISVTVPGTGNQPQSTKGVRLLIDGKELRHIQKLEVTHLSEVDGACRTRLLVEFFGTVEVFHEQGK
jgi:hypothetical protein